MQAVPSLVGTGTAVAAAATGLVFAQPANEAAARPLERDVSSSPLPPASLRSHASQQPGPPPADRERNVSNGSGSGSGSGSSNAGSSPSAARPLRRASPETSLPPSASAATLPRSAGPAHGAAGLPGGSWNRRHSFIHKGERIPPSISEASRDSISSNGSWIRRLSIRPLSQHGSIRSSLGPDSPSFTFSFGSAAPIVGQPASNPPQQPPRNKLVKRATADPDAAAAPIARRGSRSQMPTLRRPATSHQRSATLQQAPRPDDAGPPPKFSFDQRTRPSLAIFRLGAETPDSLDQDGPDVGAASSLADSRADELPLPRHRERGPFQAKWTSFFHGRIAVSATTGRGRSPFSPGADGSPGVAHQHDSLPSRTIQVQRGAKARAYLTQASALSALEPASFQSPIDVEPARSAVEREGAEHVAASPQDTPSKRAKRSISMHFSSPTSWMSKTGSIRRTKRGSDHATSSDTGGKDQADSQAGYQLGATSGSTARGTSGRAVGGRRHVSAPLAGSRPSSSPAPTQHSLQGRNVTAPADLHLRRAVEGALRHSPRAAASALAQSAPGPGPNSPGASYAGDRAVLARRPRNSSSPLPPLSHVSSFNVDLSRLGSSSSSSALATTAAAASGAAYKENQPTVQSGFATLPRAFPLVSRQRDISDERPSTLAGSDLELRGFVSSGDDDDTDFKSDTVFDSVRTAASTRIRSTETPIESMFDESPPSTASNSKAKRLSIQEILGQAWDSDTRIMEEDEGFSTPIRHRPTRPARSLSPSSVLHHLDEDYVADESQRYVGNDVAGDARAETNADADATSVLASTTADTDGDVDAEHGAEDDREVEAEANVRFSSVQAVSYDRPSLDDDEFDDNWARVDENGVTNHLSPPSRSLNNSLRGLGGFVYENSVDDDQAAYAGHAGQLHRSALASISGNGGLDPSDQYGDWTSSGRERPRSNLFDWSESTVHLDKVDGDGHSLRPKTVHGKQELDLRNGRPSNRKGPVVAHVRSQSVPVIGDPAEGAKPSTSKFGTWASGPKNASEDWDDDFDFGTNCSGDAGDDTFGGFGSEEEDVLGEPSTTRSGKGVASAPFTMVVPASIQATQPTVKAHSGQIRELSLLVNGLKRLCRHARDLNIVDEEPALWKEAENIIALASPDEDLSETATAKAAQTGAAAADVDREIPRASVELEAPNAATAADNDDSFIDRGFDAATLDSFGEDSFDAAENLPPIPVTPPPEMSRTAVVRERQNVRRRSVFSPDDDIFGGGWPLPEERSPGRADEREQQREPQQEPPLELQRDLHPPRTPDRFTTAIDAPDSAMIESIMEAMQQQRSSSAPIRRSPVKQASTSELFFNTNTLQELVKRANSLFHNLSDLVRRAELITQSPAVTPRHDRLNRREDGSPAFTRVFTDPSSPSRRLPKSHSTNSAVGHASPSLESPPTSRVSQRLQMMTVN